MKRKPFLLVPTFLLLSVFSMSQLLPGEPAKPCFAKTGIKKRISELLAVKPGEGKPVDLESIKSLRFSLKKFANLTKPAVSNVAVAQREEATGKDALGLPTTVTSTPTQQVASNFLSLDFYDNPRAWPPDPSGDVGSTQVIVASNLGFKVYDKPTVTDLPIVTNTGYSRDQPHSSLFLTLRQFFSPVLPEGTNIFDPHIRYDRLTKRWFVVAAGGRATNLIYLAVSDGDRVTDSSSFQFYSFKTSLFPGDSNQVSPPFFDYPMLGVDKNSVLIGGNFFYFNTANGVDSLTNVGCVIDKMKLIKGELLVYAFKLGTATLSTGEGMLTPHGVYNGDPEAKKSFFAGITYYNDGIVVAAIEYDKKNKPRLASESIVQVEPFNFPRDNSAPGSLTAVDVQDARLFEAAIYKNKLTGNSSLWTAQAIGVDKSGRYISGSDSDFVREARTGSRWYKIGNIYTKPALLQVGTVYDAEQSSGRRAVQYFNPSVAASGQGHSIVSGTTDAYNDYLNVFAAGRYLGDPLGKTRSLLKVTNTTAIYAPYVDMGNGSHAYVGRWGDFSQTVVDPFDDQTIWTFQEYANVDDSYGIRVIQFKAPPPATPAAIGTVSNKTDTTVTLEGKSVENSGFFDPGKDVGGPGYNKLSVKSTGNIVVSNVNFISPTKISFTLHTENKPAGQYILIITNPDGQLMVSDFTIADGTLIAGKNSPSPNASSNKIPSGYISRCEVYPNPTTNNVTLAVDATSGYLGKIVLISANGKVLSEENYSFSKGINKAVLQTQNLAKGTYIVAIYDSGNNLAATQKIIRL